MGQIWLAQPIVGRTRSAPGRGALAHALQAAGEGVVFRALLPETKQVPPSAWPLDHDKRTSLLAKDRHGHHRRIHRSG